MNQLFRSDRVLGFATPDSCCSGRQPLREASPALDSVLDDVLFAATDGGTEAVTEWGAMSPTELIDHLESTHRRYIRAELPRLDALAEQVASVHGGQHPELLDVLADIKDLRDDLEPHLVEEARVLFPMIRELSGAHGPVTYHGHSLRDLITIMLAQHDRAVALLEQLRGRTNDYTTPVDECAAHRDLYDGLAVLDAGTHLHVHKENSLLFPAVAELESRISQR